MTKPQKSYSMKSAGPAHLDSRPVRSKEQIAKSSIRLTANTRSHDDDIGLRRFRFRRFRFRSGFLTGLGVGVALSFCLICTASWIWTAPLLSATKLLGASHYNLGTSDQNFGASHFHEASAADDAEPVGRSVREIRKDIAALIKNSKQKSDLSLQVASVLDLCRIHYEITSDPRFQTHDQFRGFRARVATRLKKYKAELEVEMKRRQRRIERAQKLARQKIKNATDKIDVSEARERPAPETDPWDLALNQSMYEMGEVTGAPSQLFGYLGGNYAPPWDYGQDLVDLIERTISPDTWLRNGGEGRIHYYRPSMVIVVSASQRVHDEMTDLLRLFRFMSQ